MLKSVLAVIAGYVVMLVFIFLTFSGVYLAMGADRAFLPGTYEVSMLWLAVCFALSLAAAIAGGWVCGRVAGSAAAPRALAALVLVLGVVMALPTLNPASDPRPTVRASDVPNMEAMTNARQPAWVAFLLPVIGAAGVMIGAGRTRR